MKYLLIIIISIFLLYAVDALIGIELFISICCILILIYGCFKINNHIFLPKKFKKKLTKLEISELILDYTHSFSSQYMHYEGLTEFIKKMNFKDRMFYIINSCNKDNPTKYEQFLLSLAYCNLGTLYTDYAIYYLKLYLGRENFYSDEFYNKKFRGCNTFIENRNYQLNLLYIKLSRKYLDNLEYDNALKYALKSKNFVNYNNYYQSFLEPFSLISEILYKQGDIRTCIANIKEGIMKTKNQYNKKGYIELLNKYEEINKENKIYKPRKIKRPRLNIQTNVIYDLTTGENIN